MGLLNRATAGQEKSDGLLLKTNAFSNGQVYNSFFEFCKKYKFAHCAILKYIENNFIISHCIGIDAKSIAASVSSRDFWEGTIGTDVIEISFGKIENSLAPFYQFFSNPMKEKICGIHFIRISRDAIFMKVDTAQYEDFFSSAETLKNELKQFVTSETVPVFPNKQYSFSNNEAQLLLLSMKIAIDDALELHEKNSALSVCAFNALYDELYGMTEKSLQAPNAAVKKASGEIKLIIYSHDIFDEQLFRSHIARHFASILGPAAKSLVILKIGTAHSTNEIIQFIDEG